ncbi:MAG: Bacterial regulatory protein luxR family [Chloroflexota bacterium]|jgi:hypothetical protein|nr:Bacterial regulatory protein luxR family [Chloroflexota bacterium]
MSGSRRRGAWRDGADSGSGDGPRAGCGRRGLAAGSEEEAAHRLGLSHSTVKHHLANARSKVGATTTAQLVWILATRLPEATDLTPQAKVGGATGPARPR